MKTHLKENNNDENPFIYLIYILFLKKNYILNQLCFWVKAYYSNFASQGLVSLQTERPSSSIGTLEGFFFFWFSLLFLWVFSSTSASFFWVSFLCSVLICIWNYPPVFVIGNVHHLNSEIYGQIRVSVCGVVSREYGNPGV